MRTGFGEHMLAGMVIFIILLLIFGIPQGAELPLAGTFFILGAVMPDVDSTRSRQRRAVRWMSLLLGFLVLLLFYPQLYAVCSGYAKDGCQYLSLVSILFLLGVACVLDSLIPRHRGFLHSFSAAVLYGSLTCLLMFYLGEVGSLRIGIWALCGYLTHLVVDAIGDATPF